MKKIIAKEQLCMGCGLCEVYCTVSHSKIKDIIKAYNRENPRPTSRVNLLHGWSLEIKDIMGGMGINAIESLRGNRLALRGVGLTDTELKILGVKMAGD